MNGERGPNFPFMPFPMAIFGPNSQQQANLLDNDAPARVKVALQFLDQVSSKTMPRCAVNDISIEWKDGQKLTGNELAAHGAACSLLIDYFGGKLKSDDWENLRHAAAARGIVPSKEPGTILRCVFCSPHGEISPDCQLCLGRGVIVVYPASGDISK